MSWQHTSIWSWERWNSQWNTSWLRTRDIMNGERLGNVIVYLSLSKAALVQHLPKATLLYHSSNLYRYRLSVQTNKDRQLMDDENSALMNYISSVRPTQKDRSSNPEQTDDEMVPTFCKDLSRSLCGVACSRYQIPCRYYLSCTEYIYVLPPCSLPALCADSLHWYFDVCQWYSKRPLVNVRASCT